MVAETRLCAALRSEVLFHAILSCLLEDAEKVFQA